MSWEHQGYIYYGNKDIPGLPDAQGPDENNCWARALAALIGVDWSYVALNAPLDDLITGQSTVNTRKTAERLNKALEADGAKRRLTSPLRWYSADWSPQVVETKFPCALGIDGHFIVALGIGFAKNQLGRPKICYWDTDCNIYYKNLAEFKNIENPEFSFVRVDS